jgi:hypothetical protein
MAGVLSAVVFLIWVAISIYLLILATRLENAVERIAANFGNRP